MTSGSAPIVHIVGARPNFVKATPVVHALAGHDRRVVHTGQHYDEHSMPEEINRRLTDSLSDVHLVTSPEAIGHLAREGINPDNVHLVGNPMIDTLFANMERFDPAPVRATRCRRQRSLCGGDTAPTGQR